MAHTELIRVGQRPQGLVARLVQAMRSFTIGPMSLKDPELARMFGGGPGSSGVSVNEFSALSQSAVWGAVTLVSDDVASTPLVLYKRVGRNKERFEDHPLYRVLHDEPNPEMSSMVFRRTMHAHLMLWQNAYAEIERDGGGRPVALWPLVPERVSPFRERGVLRYRVSGTQGARDIILEQPDMVHLVGYSHDGSVGSSLVALARESIGLALAAEKFGGTFFGNGATFGGVIEYPGPKPTELGDRNYTTQLNARHQGVERAHKLLALYNGAKYTPTGTPPDSAQFLETRVFQIRETSRWFRVPPHKLGDLADATFSNVEQEELAYRSGRLRSDFQLWEQELSRKLIAKSERRIQAIEHVTQAMESVDAAGRAALYPARFNVGSVTPNQIRAWENENPLEGGDRSFVPMNMIALDRYDEYLDAQIESMESKAKPPEPPPVAPANGNGDAEAGRAKRDELEAALVVAAKTAEGLRLQQERSDEARRVAEQRADDLSAAQAAAEKSRDEAVAKAFESQQVLLREQSERASEKAEATRVLEKVAGDRDDAFAKNAELRKSLVDVTTARDAARHEADAHEQSVNEWREKYHSSEAQKAETETRNAELVAMVQAAEQAAAERRADMEAAAAEAVKRLEAFETGATATAAKIQALGDAMAAALEARAQAFATLEDVSRELSSERDAAIAAQQQAEADKEAALQLAEAAERDKGIAETAQIAANQLAVQRQQESADRLTRMVAATRGLMVDAMGRVIRRETEKARRNHATPEKLRAWMRSFYVLHEETSIEMLQPAIKAHLSLVGSEEPAAEATGSLVRAHIAESLRQLEAVADTEHGEFPVVLAKLLNRWDTQRADELADRLLQEEVRHVSHA